MTVLSPILQQYSDGVVAYCQYKQELGLTQKEATQSPDLLETFGNLCRVVQDNPELASAYTGVLKFRGEKKQTAVELVRATETDIVDNLADLELISPGRQAEERRKLSENPEIKERAIRFVRLFKKIIPPEQLPKKPPKKIIASPRPPEAVQTKPQAKPETLEMPVKRTHSNSEAVTNYILSGQAESTLKLGDAKRALRDLAGQPILNKDRQVLQRYLQVQKSVAKLSIDPGEGMPLTVAKTDIDDFFTDLPSWQKDAACLQSGSLFFPVSLKETEFPKAVCAGCAVKDECLEMAITEGHTYGVWGGLNEPERRAYKRAIRHSGASNSELIDFLDKLRNSKQPDAYDEQLDKIDSLLEQAG